MYIKFRKTSNCLTLTLRNCTAEAVVKFSKIQAKSGFSVGRINMFVHKDKPAGIQNPTH